MAFGYQLSGDPSMSTPMLAPQAGGGGMKPMGGDAMGAFGKKLGAAMRDSQASGQGVSQDPSGGALGAMSSAEAAEYQSPNTGSAYGGAPVGSYASMAGTGGAGSLGGAAAGPAVSSDVAARVAGATSQASGQGAMTTDEASRYRAMPPSAIGGFTGQGAMTDKEAAAYGSPLGYSAADMGAQAWQPRSAVGPRPFGY